MRTVFKTSYDADIRLFRHGAQAFWYGALLVCVLALPLVLSTFLIGEATNVLIWALAGMGLMVLTGQAGLVSIGHTAFLAVGCYVNAILQMKGVPFLVAFPLSGLAAGIVGVLVAIPALRLHGIYLAIATLAMAVLVEDIIVIAEPVTGGVTGLVSPVISLFGVQIDRYGAPALFYYLVLAVVLAVVLVYRNLLRSPLGRAFAAIRDSEISAQAMGVSLIRTKAAAFGVSCAITGLAGALMGHFAGAFNHETFNLVIAVQMLLMIVVGGLGSIHGAFFGAIVIGVIPTALSFLRDFVAQATGSGSVAIPGLESGVFGAILIAFILFEPMGIYGRWLKIRTYLELFPFYRRDMFRRQKTYLKTERMR
jgi:branched-chain amino acid transport system permease protein